MVLGRGLVFQPVLVTHICTYNRLQIFHKKKKFTYRPHLLPPLPKPTTTTTKEFMILVNVLTSLQMSKLHIKKDKNQNQMTNIIEST